LRGYGWNPLAPLFNRQQENDNLIVSEVLKSSATEEVDMPVWIEEVRGKGRNPDSVMRQAARE
jgi:hypothetical protein